MYDAITARQMKLRRFASLETEQSTWRTHWQELCDYIQPRRGAFVTTERNQGTKKHQKIINSRPSRASRVAASGRQSGITSPTRPWFRLTTPYTKLNEIASVKAWLAHVEDRMRQVFQRSNIYMALANVYLDLAVIGTAVMHVEEDTDKVIRAYVFPVGQYYLAADAQGRIDTCYRKFSMTVGQLVEKFGIEKCSQQVRLAFEQHNLEQWVEVLHIIEPNRDYQPDALGRRGMKWSSCWLEFNAGEGVGYLHEGGFYECPFIAPRESTKSSEDVYGSSPGMEALADCKALQLLEDKKLIVAEKLADPPMRGPSALMSQPFSTRPGAMTFVDSMAPGQTFAPAYQIESRALDALELVIRQHESRIDESFDADLWLMLDRIEQGKMTATEVLERQAEKMLQLGPMLERFEDEALDPLFERVFAIMLRNGLIPEPPQEMQGVELRVEYVSILAQAQKATGIQGVRELIGFVANLAAAQAAAGLTPDAWDKVDTDQTIDEYSSMIGTPPELVRSDEDVEKRRAARAKAQAQAAQMQQMQQGAETAKTLAQADTEGENALTRVLDALGVRRAA